MASDSVAYERATSTAVAQRYVLLHSYAYNTIPFLLAIESYTASSYYCRAYSYFINSSTRLIGWAIQRRVRSILRVLYGYYNHACTVRLRKEKYSYVRTRISSQRSYTRTFPVRSNLRSAYFAYFFACV